MIGRDRRSLVIAFDIYLFLSEFTASSDISLIIYRKSRLRRKHAVAEYNGRGMDFLDTSKSFILAHSSQLNFRRRGARIWRQVWQITPRRQV